MGHDLCEPRANAEHKSQCGNNSITGRVSRAQYDTRDTYGWCICKQYEHYNVQTRYAWMHILYILPLLPTYRATVLKFLAHRSLPIASRYYRTMLGSVYLQKIWVSLPKSAECHLSWVRNHSSRATYITSQLNALTFCKLGYQILV